MPGSYPATNATTRWTPRTEQDLSEATSGGWLEENHFLEFKRDIPTTKASNKELARDLAQFAIDGGTLIVGIAEGKEADGGVERLGLAPVPLSGLSERVEQIARSAIDPPLLITTNAITCAADPSAGYLVVHVPPSGLAPRMVDGVYYGRDEKTKRRLSDAEVRRLHAAQAHQADVAREELARYVDRDPVPTDLRKQAHLFAVAVPLSPRPEMLLDVTGGRNVRHELGELMDRGGHVPHDLANQISPRLTYANVLQTRQDGVAMTYGLENGRTVDTYEDVVEAEFSEDGIVRILTTRLSDAITNEGGQVLFVVVMPITVRQLVGIAAAVSDRAGYGGMWALGVAATGIAGLPANSLGRYADPRGRVGADVDRYKRFTQASSVELAEQPGKVAERLVGRFLRSVGAEQQPNCRQALE